ncbi:MAG: hypothetical protein LBK18_10505 [Prevotellaceae bacterium]|nr:hypothetical protein [Prevotellaceae bacterium]
MAAQGLFSFFEMLLIFPIVFENKKSVGLIGASPYLKNLIFASIAAQAVEEIGAAYFVKIVAKSLPDSYICGVGVCLNAA